MSEKECQYRELIKEIPGPEGFWTSGCEDAYRAAAIRMDHAGMDQDEILDILQELYNATRGEYGN